MAQIRYNETEHPMAGVCTRWLALLEEAKKQKYERFGKYANEAYNFYNGPCNWMWEKAYARGSTGYLDSEGMSLAPTFQMSVNKIFEAVALYGPVLFHQYPQVTVNPVTYPAVDPSFIPGVDPLLVQQQMMLTAQTKDAASRIKAHYLNWVQVEANKKKHSRRGITEAVVKGMGLSLTEMFTPQGSRISYPRSRHISCDQLLKDPDAKYAEDVQWIAIEWVHPVNLVEKKFSLPPGSLKGHMQSMESATTPMGAKDRRANRNGGSHDLIRYYEIYSKNGFGHRLKATNKAVTKSRLNFDFLGDMTRIVVAKGVPYPLNMPSWSLAGGPELMMQLSQWPIPFWSDEGCGGGWPVSELGFWYDTNDVWPISLIKPAIGEIRFVNWCMSFLADKVAAASHDYLGVAKMAAESIREQIRNGTGPFTIIEIEEFAGKKLDELISFVKPPAFGYDVWKMVSEVMAMIDKRTGLTELAYGLTGASMRSATEASVKQDNINIRPQDMANSVEDWLSEQAMKECEAAVWMLDREHYEPVVGPVAAEFWEQYIATQDFDSVVRDFSYRIAAGSARRPNREGKQQALNDFGRVAMPAMQERAAMGDIGPLAAYLQDVAETLQLDPSRYAPTPIAPQAEPADPEAEDAHQQELRITAEKAGLEMEIEAAKAAQELEQDEEMHEQEVRFAREMAKARPKPSTNGSR